MESADGQRGRDGGGGGQRRSALDIIMSQIRRKRSASDRKPLGRFLSRSSEQTGVSEEDENRGQCPGASVESEHNVGWGRVCVFLQKMGKNADSRSLSLAHCDLTATDLLELASLLQFLPLLEEMDVSWNELIGGSLTALTFHLHHVAKVRTLKLCCCRLNAADVTALGGAFGSIPLLEILDLSWNNGAGGGALQSLVGKLPAQLRELHLVACRLTAVDAAALGAMVADLPKLCVLDVSCNPQLSQAEEGDGFKELASSLAVASSLIRLRVQACGLIPESLEALGSSLCSLSSLREIDLSSNKHLSGGLKHLTSHLTHLTHLESLDLHLCGLTNADLTALIQVLPSLTALTELDISANQETGSVVHELVSALPLTQMRRLPLNSCRLSEESFTALALAAPCLRSIDVSWCKVVGGRLPLLLDALQPSVVTELRLGSCELTDGDLRHLAEVCRRGCMSSLRLLDLSYNGSVGDGGWSSLFAAGGLGSLEEMDVSLRPSTCSPCSAWLSVLLGALPRMPALARLALQRWTAGAQERRQLRHSAKNRNIRLDWDPDGTDWKSSSLEESQPEE